MKKSEVKPTIQHSN